MDLGISGRSALICASSAGLGFACAKALIAEGVEVTINGRNPDRLEKAATELSEMGLAKVSFVASDVTKAEGREKILEVCPNPDILLNNNAGPSAKHFTDTDMKDWESTLDGNMVAPLMMIQAVIPKMVERKFGRIVNITSAMVTTPRPHHVLSSGARAGLTASSKAISMQVAQHNVTINNLLPERIDTNRQHQMAEAAMKRDNISYKEARRQQIESVAAKRLGRPEEFAAAFAFLCGADSGFISGQNIHVDGGSYPALI